MEVRFGNNYLSRNENSNGHQEKSNDQIFYLPLEIWEKIFFYLLSNVKDLANCQLVCKEWNNVILSIDKFLWRNELKEKGISLSPFESQNKQNSKTCKYKEIFGKVTSASNFFKKIFHQNKTFIDQILPPFDQKNEIPKEFELIASKDYGVCELFFQQLIKSLWLIGDKENALYYFNRLKKNKIFWKVFSAWDYIINYVAQSGNLSGALVLINEHSDQEWKRRALVSIAKLKIRERSEESLQIAKELLIQSLTLDPHEGSMLLLIRDYQLIAEIGYLLSVLDEGKIGEKALQSARALSESNFRMGDRMGRRSLQEWEVLAQPWLKDVSWILQDFEKNQESSSRNSQTDTLDIAVALSSIGSTQEALRLSETCANPIRVEILCDVASNAKKGKTPLSSPTSAFSGSISQEILNMAFGLASTLELSEKVNAFILIGKVAIKIGAMEILDSVINFFESFNYVICLVDLAKEMVSSNPSYHGRCLLTLNIALQCIENRESILGKKSESLLLEILRIADIQYQLGYSNLTNETMKLVPLTLSEDGMGLRKFTEAGVLFVKLNRIEDAIHCFKVVYETTKSNYELNILVQALIDCKYYLPAAIVSCKNKFPKERFKDLRLLAKIQAQQSLDSAIFWIQYLSPLDSLFASFGLVEGIINPYQMDEDYGDIDDFYGFLRSLSFLSVPFISSSFEKFSITFEESFKFDWQKVDPPTSTSY